MTQDQEILELDCMTADFTWGGGGHCVRNWVSGMMLRKNTGCNTFNVIK
jgi:hypothetical protein